MLGENLCRLRKAMKYTQKEFADFLGIPQPSLSAYENNRNTPTAEVLINIATKCNVSLDWLCGLSKTSYTCNTKLNNKRDLQLERIHKNQNKDDCFVSVGDTVRIKFSDGDTVTGVILDYDLKKETTTLYKGLHPCMDIGVLPYDKTQKTYANLGTVWIENIVELEVIKFRGE